MVLDFLGERPGQGSVDGVNARSVGKGRDSLSAAQLQRLEALIHPTLQGLGYA